MQENDRRASLRFIIPIIVENLLTTLVGLVFSALIGHISPSALAATSMANTIFSLLGSMLAMLYVGAPTVAARLTGAGDYAGTSEVFEQAFFVIASLTVVMTALCFAASKPLLGLLLPTAEEGLFSEALRYYRLQLISFPFYIYMTCATRLLRATGESKLPMVCMIVSNAVQVLFGYVFIVAIPLEVLGAGIAYIACRAAGAVFSHICIARSNRRFSFSLKNALKPKWDMIRRILRIGYPTSIQNSLVNVGYLLASSMLMGLGTFEATVYSILTTLGAFAQVPGSVCNGYVSSVCGRQIGGGQWRGAIRTSLRTWIVGIGATVAVGAGMALAGTGLTGLYSEDAGVIAASAQLLWLIMGQYLCTTTENVYAGSLCVAGAPKFVMYITLICVWLVRLPLTYLFCYVLHLGAMGAQLANMLNLFIRGLGSLIYFNMARWKNARV